jgi:hypothetical protein
MNLRYNGYKSLVLLFLFLPAVLRAEVGMSLGAEYYNLTETLEGQGELVDETGPRFVLGLYWTQEKPEGWSGRYDGEFYTGNVNYDGETQLGDPYQTTTEYLGTSQEATLVRGWSLKDNHHIQAMGTLGMEVFRRTIVNGGGDQKEDFQILYARLGIGYSTRPVHGISVDGGVKYPFRVVENAHLEALGLASNPTLHPKGLPSLYGSVEYHFSEELGLQLYYDSYRFGTSDPVSAVADTTIGTCTAGSTCSIIQPQTNIYRLGVLLRTAF